MGFFKMSGLSYIQRNLDNHFRKRVSCSVIREVNYSAGFVLPRKNILQLWIHKNPVYNKKIITQLWIDKNPAYTTVR